MKTIAQVCGWYFPDTSGGTEVYIEALSAALKTRNRFCTIVAPWDGITERFYDYRGTSVYRYPVYPNPSITELRGEIPHKGFEFFERWLGSQAFDIYHQHSWSLGCNLHHLRFAKNLGLKTVMTIHVPAHICLRGTMMLYGQKPCNGYIEERRCSACWGQIKGMPLPLSKALAAIPKSTSDFLKERYSFRGMAPFIRRTLVEEHLHRFQEMVNYADHIVAVCQWLYDALLINGVHKEKLSLCRQGIGENLEDIARIRKPLDERGENQTLRIGFLGRWDQYKGIHILVKAIKQLPKDMNVQLQIYAIGTESHKEVLDYKKTVMREAKGEKRIQFFPQAERKDIFTIIKSFHLLAVPSRWLETGPYVVLEALAAKTPVLGSALGGISELIQHDKNGWLLPALDVKAWSESFTHFYRHPEDIVRLKNNIMPVRTMDEVAEEMIKIYER